MEGAAEGGDVRPRPGINGRHWADSLPGRLALGSLIPFLILLAWKLAVIKGVAVVPTFTEVARVLLNPFEPPEDFYSRSLAFSVMMTLMRIAAGFGLGALTAVPLGLLAGQSRTVDRLLGPAVQMARPINPIVLLPIATVFFGVASIGTVVYGELEAWRHDVLDQVQLAMIFILWWGAFFPVFISTVYGVRSVPRSYLEGMRLMGATPFQTFRHVLYPHALPFAANGMRIAMGVTWLVVIAAEIFPGTRSGLGYMLCVACKTVDYEYTFAAIIIVGVVAYLTDVALHALERAVGRWQELRR
jgi:NitT/TauT family transport system permease protein